MPGVEVQPDRTHPLEGEEHEGRPLVVHLAVVTALVVVGLALRVGPLGPSSLWLDDAWAALVSRAHGPGEAVRMGLTAPGLALLHYGLSRMVTFTDTWAQVLPLVFAVAGPALVYIVAVRHAVRAPAAVVGATLLLASPVHVVYATRVKQYSLDAVLAMAVVAVAWRVLDAPRRRERWVWLTLVSIGVTMASAAVAPYVAAAYLAGGLAALRARGPALRWAATATAVYGSFAAGWWLLFLRPVITPDLRSYWSDFYPTLAPSTVAGAVWRVIEGFSALPVVVAAVLAVSVVVVARRRPETAVLLCTPTLVAIVLGVLEAAPLGGGRTDVYLYPALALLVAVALDELPVPRPVAWLGGLAVAAVLVVALPDTPFYPPEDVRPLIAEAERRAGPDDVVLVYPATRWAYGLYTAAPVAFGRDTQHLPGFDLDIRSPSVRVLGPHRDDPAQYTPEVLDAVTGRAEVWLIASHWRDDLGPIEAAVSATGRRLVDRVERPGAVMVRWSSP